MKQRKNDDGYVLVYVLVVFLVLSTVAAALCSSALKNLKAQEASVQRSQDLYDAEGEIEKFVAQVRSRSKNRACVSGDEAAAAADYWNEVKANVPAEQLKGLEAIGTQVFEATLQSQSGNAQINSKIKITLDVYSWTETERDGEGNVIASETFAVVRGAELAYNSYDISLQGGGEE